MTYQLASDETLPAGIRRIVLEQLDDATGHLIAAGEEPQTSIHAARQCFKRVRAVLCLLRDELGDKAYTREHRCFRDAGRRLAAARDAEVVVETLAALERRFVDQLAPRAFGKVRRAIKLTRSAQTKRAVEEENALWKVAGTVAAARDRVTGWPLERDSFAALRLGLKSAYRRGRHGLATVERDASAERYHEWRKPVKCLWHHVQILSPIFPSGLAAFAHDLHGLSEYLSENHDLAVLRAAVLADPKLSAAGHEVEALVALVDERCAEFEALAKPLGRRLYAERPSAFVSRIEAYWSVWRSEGKTRAFVVGGK